LSRWQVPDANPVESYVKLLILVGVVEEDTQQDFRVTPEDVVA
jgi:hypothetical protein